MMAEQKGRGGKKPKYQIADIGGSDLTPQDLSTERVLNFLIKGENPADQGEVSGSDGLAQANSSREDAAAGRREAADASPPSSGAQGKKSLDHLFRRASAGGGGAKDLKLALRAQDEATPTVPFGEMKTGGQAQPPPIAVQAEGETGHVMRPAEATATEAEHTPPPPYRPVRRAGSTPPNC